MFFFQGFYFSSSLELTSLKTQRSQRGLRGLQTGNSCSHETRRKSLKTVLHAETDLSLELGIIKIIYKYVLAMSNIKSAVIKKFYNI